MELFRACFPSFNQYFDTYNNIEEEFEYKNNNIENDIEKKQKYINFIQKEKYGKTMINKNKIFGLQNLGHSCYMNSFLQILLHTPFFLEKLRESYSKTNTNHPLIDSLLELSETDSQNRIQLLKNIKYLMAEVDESYGKKIQNDSQEFGINLIGYIISIIKGELSFSDEEVSEEYDILKINKIKKEERYKKFLDKYCKNEISLEKMFQFQEISYKININNIKELYIKKIDFDSFLNIELYFNKKKNSNYKLTDLLKLKYPKINNLNISEEESEINNPNNPIYLFWQWIKNFYMWVRGQNSEVNKSITKLNYVFCNNLYTLPNYLIITINRAILGKPIYKNNVEFEETLDLKDYLDIDSLKYEDTTYKLYGINYCYKQFLSNSGHYYCSIKINGKWFTFDDNKPIVDETPDFNSKYVIGLYYVKNKMNFN